MSQSSTSSLHALTIYCLEHDMLDTAEFTAERILAYENVDVFTSPSKYRNGDSDRNEKGTSSFEAKDVSVSNIVIGTPTPRAFTRSNADERNDRYSQGSRSGKSKALGSGYTINAQFTSSGTNEGAMKYPFAHTNSNENSESKLDSIHLYAYVLYRRGKFKTAYNVTSAYCSVHIGCSYIFAKCCKELQKENDGIRALLSTLHLWDPHSANAGNPQIINPNPSSNLASHSTCSIVPDSIACYMILAKLYVSVGDIPRAAMHYSKVLKLNPLIFEAVEELCKIGVRINVDSIYTVENMSKLGTSGEMDHNINININNGNTNAGQDSNVLRREVGPILENGLEHEFSMYVGSNNGSKNEKLNKSAIFKTPSAKIKQPIISTSSPESTYMTPINRSQLKSQTNRSLNSRITSSASKKNASITSRLLHNNNKNDNHDNSGGGGSRGGYSLRTGEVNNNIDSATPTLGNKFSKDIYEEGTNLESSSKINILESINNDVFKTNPLSAKYGKGNGLFNSIGNSTLFGIKEDNSIDDGDNDDDDDDDAVPSANNLNNTNHINTNTDSTGNNMGNAIYNEYFIAIYSKLAKGYIASTSFDCFKAIRIFDSLPENERNSPWVLSKLGRLHFEIVNYEEAENYFEKLRRIDRTRLDDMEYYSTLLWHLHKEVELSFLAHELYEIDPNSEISWICIGNLFSFKKEPEEAIKCFNKAIKSNPKCAYAYTLQGHEYLATDAFENALNSFRHAILLDKRHYNAFYGIGMVYLKLGDFRKAEFHFRKAVEINPVNVILLCCVGMVLEKLGKREESLKQYEFATKLQPLSMLALFKKAQVLFALGNFEEALKDFEKLENLAPDEASVHFLLGKLYKHFGRKHDAIKQFTISLNLDPKGSHLIKEALENLNDEILE